MEGICLQIWLAEDKTLRPTLKAATSSKVAPKETAQIQQSIESGRTLRRGLWEANLSVLCGQTTKLLFVLIK